MKLYGDGRVALAGDQVTADKLGWGERRRSLPDPERVLAPRQGDPRLEPWIAPPWWDAALSLDVLRRRRRRRMPWSYLPDVPGVLRYLEVLAKPRRRDGVSVAIAGMGRVGGTAATVLAATPSRRSGIRELLVYDVDGANQERWVLELLSVGGWRQRESFPRLHPTSLAQVFTQCDVFVFAATEGVPPLGWEGDVRLPQFEPNRAILRAFLDHARAANFAGLFLVVSDPVDLLAQAVFHDSNVTSAGRFTGEGLAPESTAGLGLGVMWARALACARREGWEQAVSLRGGAYGPHSGEVVAFDDLVRPSTHRCEQLSRAAREWNYSVRNLGFLPFVGPGVSSVALTLPRLLAAQEALASVFVAGLYFGAPARLDHGLYPSPHAMAPAAFATVGALHARLTRQVGQLGLAAGAEAAS